MLCLRSLVSSTWFMLQTLDEIKHDEHIQEEQAFYGEMAFNEWLSSRGFEPPSPRKQPEVTSSKKSKSSTDVSEKPAPRESIAKANSRRRQTIAASPVPDDVILQEFPRRQTVRLECSLSKVTRLLLVIECTVIEVIMLIGHYRDPTRFHRRRSATSTLLCSVRFPVFHPFQKRMLLLSRAISDVSILTMV